MRKSNYLKKDISSSFIFLWCAYMASEGLRDRMASLATRDLDMPLCYFLKRNWRLRLVIWIGGKVLR